MNKENEHNPSPIKVRDYDRSTWKRIVVTSNNHYVSPTLNKEETNMFPYYLNKLSNKSLSERIAYYIELAMKELADRGITNVSKNMVARRYALGNNDLAAANTLYANP